MNNVKSEVKEEDSEEAETVSIEVKKTAKKGNAARGKKRAREDEKVEKTPRAKRQRNH